MVFRVVLVTIKSRSKQASCFFVIPKRLRGFGNQLRLREKFVEACHFLTLLYLQSLQLRLHSDDGFDYYIKEFINI